MGDKVAMGSNGGLINSCLSAGKFGKVGSRTLAPFRHIFWTGGISKLEPAWAIPLGQE